MKPVSTHGKKTHRQPTHGLAGKAATLEAIFSKNAHNVCYSMQECRGINLEFDDLLRESIDIVLLGRSASLPSRWRGSPWSSRL